MRDIARLSEKDKKALFHNTAAKMGMTDAIIKRTFGYVICSTIFFTALLGKVISLSRAAQVFQNPMDSLNAFPKI